MGTPAVSSARILYFQHTHVCVFIFGGVRFFLLSGLLSSVSIISVHSRLTTILLIPMFFVFSMCTLPPTYVSSSLFTSIFEVVLASVTLTVSMVT
ncbi:hypothetical protein BX661DRAFT_190000 [Kickxella alabastrina]|uniref:uncharacterized protein n=1 Tax=Kickxella alabastrina TaxID=61397 RepID=UPI00221EAC29|nr:uncharacterized protein BX661DRAFT_190000 [Kickxella alabastrina]KAI7819653.1 hypothetical protein BX661DRAFT_190000 [Kickxella alabastrina]